MINNSKGSSEKVDITRNFPKSSCKLKGAWEGHRETQLDAAKRGFYFYFYFLYCNFFPHRTKNKYVF